MKRLRRSYTALELDLGEGMAFHPVTGEQLPGDRRLLHFNPKTCQLYVFVSGESNNDYPRIGDGTDHRSGEAYLLHWNFDPLTGQRLKKGKKKEPAPSAVLTGWQMD